MVGSGKKLFRDGPDLHRLRLVEVTASAGGLVLLTYRPARPGSEGPRRP